MGPRPRPRLPTPSGAPRSAPVVVTTAARVAPVGAPSTRRVPITPTVPLPADLRATLSTIATTMRNVPREAIHDPPELFVWLNRLAKAIERLRDQPMPAPQATARPPSSAPGPADTPTGPIRPGAGRVGVLDRPPDVGDDAGRALAARVGRRYVPVERRRPTPPPDRYGPEGPRRSC